MRKLVLAIICASIASIATVAAAGSAGVADAAHPSSFRGTWVSTDLDGSNQELSIRGSGRRGHYAMSAQAGSGYAPTAVSQAAGSVSSW